MRIAATFNGPDGSANGGYAAGALACEVAPPDGSGVEVVLRRPPPLEVALEVRDGALYDGEHLVAESRAVQEWSTADAPAVSLDEAEQASRRFSGFTGHAFPRCFTCGPERSEGDGLRIFPGPVGRDDVVAAVWEPHASLGGDGVIPASIPAAIVWAALDCPSGIAVIEQTRKPAVLGRMAAELLAPVRAGTRYVVVGWPRPGAGRRSLPAASALLTQDGALVARAEAVWVSVDVPVHVPVG